MSQPYVGQMMMFAGTFAPVGWAFCQGQLVAISENETLFNLIGTTYGGDGQNTFALPDMQGRVPIHMGQGAGLSNYVLGQKAGAETVTLSTQQIPQHNHFVNVATPTAGGTTKTATSSMYLSNEGYSGGVTNNAFVYATGGGASVTMAQSSIQQAGGNQPHENVQPVLAVSWIISLFGIYPSPT